MRGFNPKNKENSYQEDEDKLYPCTLQLILQKTWSAKVHRICSSCVLQLIKYMQIYIYTRRRLLFKGIICQTYAFTRFTQPDTVLGGV